MTQNQRRIGRHGYCTIRVPAIALLSLAVVACAATNRSAVRIVEAPLAPTRINAGQTGRATLVAMGDRTEIALYLSGVPPLLVTRPVHLYAYVIRGSCADSSSDTVFALTENVLARSPWSNAIAPAGGPFIFTHVVETPLATFEHDAYVLRVFTSPTDGHHEIFCGDIGRGATS